jgi:hypothetical protein
MNLAMSMPIPGGTQHIIRAILLSVCVLMSSVGMVVSQEVTSEPPMSGMPSLIEGDLCTPPCWYGLVPGESTLEDVLQMFSNHPDLFWNELVEGEETYNNRPILYPHLDLQPLMEDQAIDFFWRETNFEGNIIIANIIRMSGNRVATMAIKPTEVVSLSEVLSQWGQPDTIRAGRSLYYDFLLLYYREPYLIVQLDTEDVARIEEECEIADLMEVFRIEHIFYLSPTAYREEARNRLQSTYYVPDHIWSSWTAGEVEATCTRAIGALKD